MIGVMYGCHLVTSYLAFMERHWKHSADTISEDYSIRYVICLKYTADYPCIL